MATIIKQFMMGLSRVIGITLLLYPVACLAEKGFMDDWHIYGSNTLRGSLYDANGPGAASPYPFEGVMLFDEFNIYSNKQNSRYDTMRAEISGVFNIDDEYRATNNGAVPERMSFVRENGDGDTPYRFEAGDLFSYYSYLTLQRSLKGRQWVL